MSDFKVMAKILTAIKVCEHDRNINPLLFDADVLGTDQQTIDSIIIKLQTEGYVEGFHIVDDIDNQPYPVIIWQNSNPSITIKGMSFIDENKSLKKALDELVSLSKGIAASKIANMLPFMGK